MKPIILVSLFLSVSFAPAGFADTITQVNPTPTAFNQPPPPELGQDAAGEIGQQDRALETEWRTYNSDRATKVLVNGRLVARSQLKELTGFLYSVELQNASKPTSAWMLELAEPKPAAAATTQPMERMRPALWRGTGETVVLVNYNSDGESGRLVRLYGWPVAPIQKHAAFVVGQEPTFEQWQSLQRPN
jgi:hypothetical protein